MGFFRDLFERILYPEYHKAREEDPELIKFLEMSPEERQKKVHQKAVEDAEKIKESRQSVPDIVKTLKPGDLSENANWMHIECVGEYLSPIGEDAIHTVTVYQNRTQICKFQCSNSIYAEWVSVCCNTMWHTKVKVLKDINGNCYPVGKLLNCTCQVIY